MYEYVNVFILVVVDEASVTSVGIVVELVGIRINSLLTVGEIPIIMIIIIIKN